MCTRFVWRGDHDVITGFNFDIDKTIWDHQVCITAKRFYIGIMRPDCKRHGYHGVHANGNAGTLLYVHGNERGRYRASADCVNIADLTEAFISGTIRYPEVRNILRQKTITYAPDATMQAMLSDLSGRTLVIEPGIGWREETTTRFSLITNYSLLAPMCTQAFVVPGDHRYEYAQRLLDEKQTTLSIQEAFDVLQAVQQEEPWATRVSFVYSVREKAVYYCEDRAFYEIRKVRLCI